MTLVARLIVFVRATGSRSAANGETWNIIGEDATKEKKTPLNDHAKEHYVKLMQMTLRRRHQKKIVVGIDLKYLVVELIL